MAVHLHDTSFPAMAISNNERQFFVAMGERIAQLRRARYLTQAQLAEVLGVAQQTVQGYEAGSRRIPVSTLPVVADTLAVSLDELFGSQAKAARASGSKRGPVPQWQQHIEAISRLPRSRQQFVSDMLRNVLGQADAR